MTTHLARLITTSMIVLGLESSIAMAQPGSPAGIDVPLVPPHLQAPAGHSVFFTGHALGTQNYICLPTGAGVSWRFVAPQATLFQALKGDILQQITTHFLSGNPSENGVPRPTWQHSFDSSQVWGRSVASSADPHFVAPDAIPWLLLEAAGAELGPAGGSTLTQTTFIQRLNTSGGVAPSAGCSQSTEIGTLVLVPYAADYFFYEASQER